MRQQFLRPFTVCDWSRYHVCLVPLHRTPVPRSYVSVQSCGTRWYDQLMLKPCNGSGTFVGVVVVVVDPLQYYPN